MSCNHEETGGNEIGQKIEYTDLLNQPRISCHNEKVKIIKNSKNEPAIIRKRCFDLLEQEEAFFFELENKHDDFYSEGVFPLGVIPMQFCKESLSVKISGNVISCVVGAGCSEPNVKLAYFHLFEVQSIKINK